MSPMRCILKNWPIISINSVKGAILLNVRVNYGWAVNLSSDYSSGILYIPLQFVCHWRANIKYSPWKMWYVASMIRGMSIEEALKQLSFVNKKGAVQVRFSMHFSFCKFIGFFQRAESPFRSVRSSVKYVPWGTLVRVVGTCSWFCQDSFFDKILMDLMFPFFRCPRWIRLSQKDQHRRQIAPNEACLLHETQGEGGTAGGAAACVGAAQRRVQDEPVGGRVVLHERPRAARHPTPRQVSHRHRRVLPHALLCPARGGPAAALLPPGAGAAHHRPLAGRLDRGNAPAPHPRILLAPPWNRSPLASRQTEPGCVRSGFLFRTFRKRHRRSTGANVDRMGLLFNTTMFSCHHLRQCPTNQIVGHSIGFQIVRFHLATSWILFWLVLNARKINLWLSTCFFDCAFWGIYPALADNLVSASMIYNIGHLKLQRIKPALRKKTMKPYRDTDSFD